MQQLFAAMHGNRAATNEFFSALTGSRPLPEFMNPENIGRIMAARAGTDLRRAGLHRADPRNIIPPQTTRRTG
jgi:hypothetical protein